MPERHIDVRILSAREVKEAKTADLDRQWRERHPEGVYCLSYRVPVDPESVGEHWRKYLKTEQTPFHLANCPNRPHGGNTRGITGIIQGQEPFRGATPRTWTRRPNYSRTACSSKWLGDRQYKRNDWLSFVKLCRQHEVPEDLLAQVAEVWDKELPTRP